YIADQFAAYGLQPAGDNGTFFQTFVISRTALTTTPELALIDKDGQVHDLQYLVDFHELLGEHAGSGRAEGTVVYMPDLENQDIQLGGRILLTNASPDPLKDAENAVARGAGGLLLITDTWAKDMATKRDDFPAFITPTIPVCELSREAFELLLSLAGYRTGQLAKTPPALPLPLSARMAVQVESTTGISVSNVLGVLPGSDPQLADQILILGAHFDHVGRLPNGTFYPGANNDASGVAVMLEIAKIWHDKGYHPQRTVLYAAWNATEKGLLGSNHYVTHPAYPLTDTLAVIQLDMVGQGRGYYLHAYAETEQDALILAHLDNAARQVEGRLTFNQYEGGSDHEPFHAQGMPAVLLSWERPEYVHMPDDNPEQIDSKKLQATGRLLTLALMTLSGQE
ncbi:MAG: Zn-dependent exopeptidase M28, partial [Chloroflexi bacterium]|nr:Zn-dependent exopeptidase M28 [Chloroflexota bacterium]